LNFFLPTFLQSQFIRAFPPMARISATLQAAQFGLFLEPRHGSWTCPTRTGQIIVVLIAIFFQTPIHMANSLMPTNSSAFHISPCQKHSYLSRRRRRNDDRVAARCGRIAATHGQTSRQRDRKYKGDYETHNDLPFDDLRIIV
jgi:hypothetical protein